MTALLGWGWADPFAGRVIVVVAVGRPSSRGGAKVLCPGAGRPRVWRAWAAAAPSEPVNFSV
jgi:hypothetical protein